MNWPMMTKAKPLISIHDPAFGKVPRKRSPSAKKMPRESAKTGNMDQRPIMR